MLKAEEGEVFLTNQTGETILSFCTGENTLNDIVAKMMERYPDQAAADLERDVIAFLTRAKEKGVIAWEA